MIHVYDDLTYLRNCLSTAQQYGKKIVFVATMGNLHEGHLALINKANAIGQFVVVSIFVNPTQFGQDEDFSKYPRTIEQDKRLLAGSIDLLFTPSVEALYPDGCAVCIDIPHITKDLCGKFRPIHFQGVLTVVNLLFNIIKPDYACFGKKDLQQMRLIERMVTDLHMDVKIIGVDTGRDNSGLAYSSRNRYLSEEEKNKAAMLYATLLSIKNDVVSGNNDFEDLCHKETQLLQKDGFSVDYLTVRNYYTLQDADADKAMVALVAARLGSTRLIDNMEIGVNM